MMNRLEDMMQASQYPVKTWHLFDEVAELPDTSSPDTSAVCAQAVIVDVGNSLGGAISAAATPTSAPSSLSFGDVSLGVGLSLLLSLCGDGVVAPPNSCSPDGDLIASQSTYTQTEAGSARYSVQEDRTIPVSLGSSQQVEGSLSFE